MPSSPWAAESYQCFLGGVWPKVWPFTSSVNDPSDALFAYNQRGSNCSRSSAAADPSQISVLDYAIRQLDQKDFRFRLQAAFAESGLDKDILESLKRSLRRFSLVCYSLFMVIMVESLSGNFAISPRLYRFAS